MPMHTTRHFARHYVEMVVAMFLGMGVLLPPLGAALHAVGTSLHGSDVLMISVMALTMTVAMLLRRDEYTGTIHHHSHRRVAA